MPQVKVLLDTDIGSDIDDAISLAYLLAQSECELLGITTTTGEAEKRAMLASVLCKAAQKEIPIFPGVEQPLLIAQRQTIARQADALQKWPHEKHFPHNEAIFFLRQTIYDYPGEIVLLTIGPLTTIALLFKIDPEIPHLLKGLVSMCGSYTNFSPIPDISIEWNALVDPHAAAIVYQTILPFHRSIPLNVTHQVTLPKEDFLRCFDKQPLLPVVDLASVWFDDGGNTVVFNDPLAAATIFDTRICTFQKGTVEVTFMDKQLSGKTNWYPDYKEGHHEIAVAVDPKRFFDHYFSVFR